MGGQSGGERKLGDPLVGRGQSGRINQQLSHIEHYTFLVLSNKKTINFLLTIMAVKLLEQIIKAL